jgi:uncharacterized protein YggE
VATQVDGPALTKADSDKLYADALRAAYADAHSRAEVLAGFFLGAYIGLSHFVRDNSSLPAPLRNDDNALREAARRVLRRALNERFGKRPLIEIQLVRL